MKQITILKYILIFIINLLLFFTFFSCEAEGEYVHKVTFIYKNRTGVDLVLEVYNEKKNKFKSFSIENGSEVEVNKTNSEGPTPFFFYNYRDSVGIYIILRYKDNSCIKYIKNYSKVFNTEKYENYGDGHKKGGEYTLYYTFTKEDDYDIAEECE